MALIECPECKREISDHAKTCPNCGYRQKRRTIIKTNIQKNDDSEEGIFLKNKKNILISIGIVLGIILFYMFLCPRTIPGLCIHRFRDASCERPQTCSRCGSTAGEAPGHSWVAATCTEPKHCSVCGISEGEPAHRWVLATCTEPKHCSVCGLTEGTANGHHFSSATCTSPKTCTVCGATEGSALGHNYVDYVCTRCGDCNVNRSDVPNILDISTLTYDVNSVGGIDLDMRFVNRSSTKTINYIELKTVFYNAVGDRIYCDIRRTDHVWLKVTGPIKPGERTTTYSWDAVFYNYTFQGTMGFEEIIITYSDGSQITIEGENVCSQAVVFWR